MFFHLVLFSSTPRLYDCLFETNSVPPVLSFRATVNQIVTLCKAG